MKAFEAYALELEALARTAIKSPIVALRDKRFDLALDGGPILKLREAISIERRRRIGAFFTDAHLAEKLFANASVKTRQRKTFLDPACGAADLLIASAEYLPIYDDLGKTLSLWGRQLLGFDLHDPFIRAAKARLILLAVHRGARIISRPLLPYETLFPWLVVGDGLRELAIYKEASHIILNPPYSCTTAPHSCSWASGKVSKAALFMATCVSNGLRDSEIVALLPDVLRTGTRYEKWREYISSRADILQVESVGQFNRHADVDVFILRAKIRPINSTSKCSKKWWKPFRGRGPAVGDLYHVHVGAVVPYRDPKKGRRYSYIHAQSLPAWQTIRNIEESRRFAGTVFKGPFVAVRRTSRPGDKHRAVGSIIPGNANVAVENHLIVLTPIDGSVHSCKLLLASLRRSETTKWLNQRIRCRHLTVSALRELPFWSPNDAQ